MKKIEKELRRKQEQEKIKLKERKGITLIALVITIIVLLILAGVSIAMLTGENGILSQAAKAKNETEKAQANEALILDEYNKFLNNAVGGTGSTTTPEEPEEEVTASDIADNKDEIGKEVEGYEANGVSSWKIFYAGTMPGESEPHIYLISSDYIPYDVIPNSTNSSGTTTSNKPNQGDYPRAANFSNILNDYAGSSRVTEARIKGLNNSYFSTGKSSSNKNMKSVAYMLDTKAWSGFATEKAEYAIGGPTIELLFKSYNQKYSGTNYIAEATSNYGYKVGSGSASGYSLKLSNTSDPLYVITSKSNACAYWLASPSAYYSTYYYVFDVGCARHCGQWLLLRQRQHRVPSASLSKI